MRARQGHKPSQSTVRVLAALLTIALSIPASSAFARDGDADQQLAFGIEMAKRGLWNEAVFRFSRVLEQRPGDVRVLNNIAVAYEAVGEFDLALEHYRRALEGDSANRDLRRNYAQFVEFYESLRPQEERADEQPAAESEADENGDAEAMEAGEESAEEGSGEPDSAGG